MSLPSRPSPARALVVLLPLLALVLGLLDGPAASAKPHASHKASHSRTDVRSAAVEDGTAWLQRRVRKDALVNAPARHTKVKVRRGAHLRKVRWVRRTTPGRVYPDVSLEVALALRRLDPRGSTQRAIVRALEPYADDYVGYRFGTRKGRYAGSTARMVSLVHGSGVPLKRFGDGTLRRSLAGMVVKKRGDLQRGRVIDSGRGGDSSDTRSQAYAVRALAALDSRYLRLAARFLAKQACPEGYFRTLMDSSDYTCAGSSEERNRVPSTDVTAYSVLALCAARARGVRHLDDEIEGAARWLAQHLRPSGAAAEDGEPNARSTALTALALKASGHPGIAADAAKWLLRMQVDDAMIERYPELRRQRGAIAWNRRALVRAKREGITRADRKLWLRSTATGAPGLRALLPPERLDVTTKTRRKRLVVRVSGLAAGERYVLRRNGHVVSAGRAGPHGGVRVKLRKPRREVRLVARGSAAERRGVTVVSRR